MGLIDDKKNVFTTIGAYVSLAGDLKERVSVFGETASEYSSIGQNTDTTNLFPSINNKQDVGSFLLDVLGVTVGTTALKDLTGQLFTGFLDNAEGTLKEAAKKQLIDFDSGLDLPDSFTLNGVTVPLKDIDIYGKMKNSPTSEDGSLLYNDVVDDFDTKVYEAILNEGTDIEYNNLLINYDGNTDTVTFKPTVATQSDKIGDWLVDYIDNSAFVNKREITSRVLDKLFGSLSSNGGKTVETLENELLVDKQIEQVIAGDDSFSVSDSDLETINNLANQLQSGSMTYDMGCGLMEGRLPISGLTNTVDSIMSTDDPNAVANSIDNTINDSFEETGEEETSDENAETIRNGFFTRLIEFLKLELAKILTTSPQARMLLALTSSFKNEGVPKIGNAADDLKNFRVYIKCIIRDILAALYEYIFNLIIGILVALIAPIIVQIIKEKINQYIQIIKSLISSRL